MNSFLAIPGGIGRSITQRTGLLTELQQKLRMLAEHDEELKKHLLKTAPPKWRDFIDEEDVLGNLFAYGRLSRKIPYGTNGFKDLTDVTRKVSPLQKAWEGTVNIAVSGDGDYRFELWFTVVI